MPMPMQRRTFLSAGAALVAPAAFAQVLPSQPVKIVVGFAPGGGTDAVARLLAQKLAPMWNTTVVVDNKAGAAGVIAAEYVAKQPPDGTTLLMANFSSHAVAPALYPKLNYTVATDFTPLTLVGVTPNVLVCRPGAPARTLQDVIGLCKGKPGQIAFGSAGQGSAQHLALEMFKLRAGVDALHVPYKGSGPMLTDLLAGQIDFSFETMSSAIQQVRAGKLVAIAQTSGRRSRQFQDVPTVAEQGFPGFEAATWYGMVGPGKMPAAMAARMSDDINKVLAMPDVAGKLEGYSAEGGGGSMGRFAEFMAQEQVRWARIIKDAKVTL
jgi:tripartite-type tricarboxylate transporter receptor subunit TctC